MAGGEKTANAAAGRLKDRFHRWRHQHVLKLAKEKLTSFFDALDRPTWPWLALSFQIQLQKTPLLFRILFGNLTASNGEYTIARLRQPL